MPFAVEAAARTHIGLVRKRNEDCFHLGQWLFAVADGLGGHVSGNVASSTAIEALRPFDRQVDQAALADNLGRAIYTANEALRSRIEAEPDLAGMGTTLVALLWTGRTAVLANVGDSRIYLLRTADTGNTTPRLIQLTEDHTYGNLVSDASDVPNLPERITRFLDGRTDGRSPDLTTHPFHDGDRFLLCSDGLSSFVPLELIEATLSSPADPAHAAERLIELALEHGGPDNVTVIVIDIQTSDP
jgi:PPM family protein phosphatase